LVFQTKKNVEPRYQQITDPEERNNKLQQILSPNAEDGSLIHQDAWFHLKFDKE
jgi:hypothetical protein